MEKIETGFGPIEKIINSAHGLAVLSSADIWALITVILLTYIIWDKKDRMKKEESWLQIRQKQIEEESTQTEVLKRLVDAMSEIKMIVTKYLIEKE